MIEKSGLGNSFGYFGDGRKIEKLARSSLSSEGFFRSGVHVYTQTCTYMYTHIYTQICTHTCTHINTDARTHKYSKRIV